MEKKIQALVFTEENAHISDPYLIMMSNIFDKVDKRRADKEKEAKESA